MHELAHAIFDAETSGASVDFLEAQTLSESASDISEERAQAFAREMLIPVEVLRSTAARRGISWRELSSRGLAALVAETHVEQGALIDAAFDYGLVPSEDRERFSRLEIWDEVRAASEHALSSRDYVRKIGAAANAWVGKRTTTVPARSLKLPVHYVVTVLNALRMRAISQSRAAELLMIDDDVFAERFGEQPRAAA
jgi:Zn-dependent peptidase ImmA (M78 family)